MFDDSRFDLFWGNDLVLEFTLTTPHPTQGGKSSPLTSGAGSAFLCTKSALDDEAAAIPVPAEAADETLIAETVEHISGGIWRVTFQSSVLVQELLHDLFADDPPGVVLEHDSGVRAAAIGTWYPSREAAAARARR